MKILVIGAAGFIGNACLNHFSAKATTLGVDCAGYPSENLLFDKEFDLIPKLIADTYDVIINCAGSSNIQGSFTDTGNDFKSNVFFVQQLLEYIKALSPTSKLINLSSAAVYGNPERLPITEQAATNPLSPYGFHKLLSEQIMEEYARLSGLNTLSVRIFSAYGAGLKRQFFYDLYSKFKNNHDGIELGGTGRESRDFIYISDILNAIEVMIIKGEYTGSVYNLASQNESFIDETARIFAAICGYTGEISFNQKQFEGYPLNWKADTSKLRSLGFSPAIKLENGLQLYYEWLKKQERV